MACRTIRLDDGVMWICGSAFDNTAVCRRCGMLAEKLCDYPVGKGKTCDSALCSDCSFTAKGDLDYCPEHAEQWHRYVPKKPKAANTNRKTTRHSPDTL